MGNRVEHSAGKVHDMGTEVGRPPLWTVGPRFTEDRVQQTGDAAHVGGQGKVGHVMPGANAGIGVDRDRERSFNRVTAYRGRMTCLFIVIIIVITIFIINNYYYCSFCAHGEMDLEELCSICLVYFYFIFIREN